MALAADSVAVNMGTTDGAPTFDQRRVARVGQPDIGAYELRAQQTITFDSLANRTFGDADFALSATASSALPVAYTASGSADVYQDAGGVWYARIDGAGGATITANQAGNNAFDPAPAASQTFTIAQAASATITVGAGPFTYNGASQAGGSGTVTGAGGLSTGATSLTYSANSDGTGVADLTNAGTYYVTAHFAGDANTTASDGAAVAVVIDRAVAAVSVSGYTGVYDAADHGATGSVSGVGGEAAGTLDLGATFRNVPGGTAHWVFTGARNYTDQSGDVAVVIARAAPSITVTPYAVTYDGNPHTATATAPTGVSGETGPTVGSVDLSGTTHTAAGTYADSWSFAGGANYADIAATPVTNTIDPAPSTTTVTIVGGPFPATGSPQTPAAVTVTGAGGLNLTPDASYGANVVPGLAVAAYHFAGDANYRGSSDRKTFTITPVHLTAVGTPDGGGPRVTVRDADGAVRFDFLAFDAAFRGGALVTVADVTRDGIDDIVVGAGPGGAPHVKVFDGLTGAEVASFFAYQPSSRGGVAVADVDRDGSPDVITGAGAGGAPHVRAFRFAGLAEVASFFAFDPSFEGGVNVASGDLDGDGAPEMVFGAGVGGGPVVKFPTDRGQRECGERGRRGTPLIFRRTARTGKVRPACRPTISRSRVTRCLPRGRPMSWTGRVLAVAVWVAGGAALAQSPDVAPLPALPPVAAGQPIPDAAPPAPDPAKTAAAVEQLTKSVEALGKNLTVVTGDERVKLVLGGSITADAFYHTARPVAPGIPFFLAPRSLIGFDQQTFDANARQTTLFALVSGPKVGDFDSGALVAVCLFNDALVVDRYGLLPIQAFAELKNEDWRFAAGLQFNVFNPLNPNVLAFSYLGGSGNAGAGFPGQFRVERYLRPADDTQITLTAALSEPLSTTVNNSLRISEDNGWPNVEARAALALGPLEGAGLKARRPFEVGVSGLVGQFRTTAGPVRVVGDVWGAGTDVRWAVTPRFGVQAEGFAGQGLGSYTAGILQNTNPVTFNPVRTAGGWVEAYYYLCPETVHSHVGYGIDDPLDSGLAPGQPTRNETYFANLVWDPTKYFRLGCEVTYRRTAYTLLGTNDGVGVQWQAQFRF